MFDASARTAELLLGESKIDRAAPAIQELRVRSGQENDLTIEPHYFMASVAAKNRRPAAVLIRRDNALEACVFFYEHLAFGIGIGIYRGGDYMGDGLVVGPEALRTDYVYFAVQFLLWHWRIHGVSLSIKAPLEECLGVMGPESLSRRFYGKTVQHKFPLLDSYQATLASLGYRTRRSLAGKRNHLEKSREVHFLPNLNPDETRTGMFALQPLSVPRRDDKFLNARADLIRKRPELFFNMGLRLGDGTWLSVLNGWRIGRTTYIDSQMNHVEFKRESVSAVMRAYMLEHETGLHQELVNFVAGSSVLFRRYCQPVELCTDAFLYRPGLQSKLFETMAKRLRPGTVYERLGPQREREEEGGELEPAQENATQEAVD